MKPKRFYTITEAARKLKVTRAAIFEAIKKERLKAKWGPIGPPPKGWRIPRDDLHKYEVSLPQQERGKKTLMGLTASKP